MGNSFKRIKKNKVYITEFEKKIESTFDFTEPEEETEYNIYNFLDFNNYDIKTLIQFYKDKNYYELTLDELETLKRTVINLIHLYLDSKNIMLKHLTSMFLLSNFNLKFRIIEIENDYENNIYKSYVKILLYGIILSKEEDYYNVNLTKLEKYINRLNKQSNNAQLIAYLEDILYFLNGFKKDKNYKNNFYLFNINKNEINIYIKHPDSLFYCELFHNLIFTIPA